MIRRIDSGSRRTTVVVAATVLLLGAALAGAAVGGASADAPSVALTNETGGSAVEAPAGETVTVAVSANASNVSAYQANLTFDPDVVRVVSVSGTDDFDDPVTNIDNESGWVAFNQYRASNVTNPRLATVTVELVGEPGNETTIAFVESDTKFSDAAAQEQNPQQYDGLTVTVESESDDGSDGSDGDDSSDDSTDDSSDDSTDDSSDDSTDDTDDTDDSTDDSSDDTNETDGDGGDGDSSDDSDDSDSDDDGDEADDDDDDRDNRSGGSGGGSGGSASGGGTGDDGEGDEPPAGPPRIASDTASPNGTASIVTTFDGESPTIDRVELLLEAGASGDYVVTEFERLLADLDESRSDNASEEITVMRVTSPEASDGAPNQLTLTLNRSAVEAMGANPDGLRIERYDEATGRWETLTTTVDAPEEGPVTLTATPSRLGWFVVTAGNSSQADDASGPANGTNPTSPGSGGGPNGTSADSADPGNTPAGDSDATANSSDAPADDSGSMSASSADEPGITQSEIPGFGVTSVLAAGALLYGVLYVRRRGR
ncbi:cohesin domain-containing protein [Halorubrum sp. HHNYT27]|uniref:cohesin domain-containing protein n=1 Tax=Halorubrum sp. HHNYT27 TaxID=3402275 RepID=UPI003EBB8EDD